MVYRIFHKQVVIALGWSGVSTLKCLLVSCMISRNQRDHVRDGGISERHFILVLKPLVLVMGPSGSGKTSFLRALAGLWNTGEGNITFFLTNETQYPDAEKLDANEERKNTTNKRAKGIFFLPQRPYMVLGTLRQQLLYPTWSNKILPSSNDPQYIDPLPFLSQTSSSKDDIPKKPTTEDLIQALELVRLGDILSRFNGLDSIFEWSSVLSLGEQQRLAFARLLLSKPRLVLLDESTSALDEANEAHLYSQIEAAGITYMSIGHRSTLYNYHNKILQISKFVSGDSDGKNWHFEPINRNTLSEEAKPVI